jgi:hypothetical protein
LAEPGVIEEQTPIVGVITLVEEHLPVRDIAGVGARRFRNGGALDSRVGDELAHIGGQQADGHVAAQTPVDGVIHGETITRFVVKAIGDNLSEIEERRYLHSRPRRRKADIDDAV